MLSDYHVHTIYSDDSEYPMEEVVKDAIAMGLEELCFTDHVDYGIKRDWDDPRGVLRREDQGDILANVDYPNYVRQIADLRERYADQITLKLGMEFGAQVHTLPQFRALYARYPFDFIILSVHQVEDKEFWNQAFQEGRTQAEYNLRYYEEMLALVRQYQDYSVLGHMDMIARYDKQGIFPFEKIKPIVAEILKTVIENGKGIEVNTSCCRYGLPDLTPSTQILNLYRDLGGAIVTIGSDSHKKAHLAAHVADTQAKLKELGFTHHCTYTGMEPVFHKL